MIDKNWKNLKNILCLRSDNLGDVLMATPAIRALKSTKPNSKVTLLTSHYGSEIARLINEIDTVIEFDLPWIKTSTVSSGQQVIKLIKKLKKSHFDAAVIFTNFSQSALPAAMICYLAEIPLRLAYCRVNPQQLLTNWLPDKEPFSYVIHGVERQLKLVESIGVKVKNRRMHLTSSKDYESAVIKKLKKTGVNIKLPWIILHPGVSEPRRQYPVTLYSDAVKQIVAELGYQVVITGTKNEQYIANDIVNYNEDSVYSLTGQLNLKELIALINLSPLLISNNTGPVHIAAALQTPVVVMYARTNPEHTPWMTKSKVLYFDPPKEHKTKNETLLWLINQNKPIPMVKPEEIVRSVKELTGIRKKIKKEIPLYGKLTNYDL